MLFRHGILYVVFCSVASAGTVYDLKADWSDTNNPNGVWAYLQGTTPLPHQTDIGAACCGANSGISGGWAPGTRPFPGNFLPLWVKTTGDNTAGWLAGDIVVHSVDGGNGDPSFGEGNITWTAPVTGFIDISGDVWYAQLPLDRSNDYFLTLGTTTLASGTVSGDNGKTRTSPSTFSVTGLSVNAGDVLRLQVQRTPGQFSGSFAGVNLTVTESSGTGTPEPATAVLLAMGLAVCLLRRR